MAMYGSGVVIGMGKIPMVPELCIGTPWALERVCIACCVAGAGTTAAISAAQHLAAGIGRHTGLTTSGSVLLSR